MSKLDDYIVDYSLYYYNPKKPKRKGKRKNLFWLILLIAAVIGTGVFVYFRFFDTSKNNSGNINVSEGTIITSEYNYYLIKLDSFDDELSAQSFATSLKNKGGAGYVGREYNKYAVYISCYLSESDAGSVKNKLLLSGYKADVVTKNIPSKKKYFLSSKPILEQSLSMIDQLSHLINYIYDMAIDFDSSTLDSVSVKTRIATKASELSNSLGKYKQAAAGNSNCQNIISIYSECVSKMQSLTNINLQGAEFSAELKYFCLSGVFLLEQAVAG